MLNENININTNLYSRQIGTYGIETMMKISKMNIFIYGMRGVGIEVAKNIILAGPNKVTIFDDNLVKINDLTANFYLKESDVIENKRRDEACFDSLSELNPYVILDILKTKSIIEHLKQKSKLKGEKYDVVVITEFMEKEILIELDNFCRKNEIGFIYGTELGIIGFCFVDFGYNFKIYEKEDEEPPNLLINFISKGNPGIINLVNPIHKSYKNKDYVYFKKVEGMTELNNCSPVKIKIIDQYNIEICDTSSFSDYVSGGIVIKSKIPSIINFESFEKKIEEPYNEEEDFPGQIDFVNPNTNEIVHIGILALYKFYKKYEYFPQLNNEKDAFELFNISKNIFDEKKNEFWIKGLKEENDNFDKLFEETIKNLSFWSRAQISPISSFLGGLIAQEIVKFTGKYIPIKQWLWLNFREVIQNLNHKETDRTLYGTRYDDQVAIFGNEIQNKIHKANIFIIGAGALGCEYLKTFSLMGFSTDKENNSSTTITDNDIIAESNLNRQFLFRKKDIGKFKSEIASQKIKEINPFFNCLNLQYKVGSENENKFDEKFWSEQDFTIMAVDNIEAREYISEQCFIYKKIFFDSGTKGTKANSQVVVPHKTINYTPSKEEEDESIPMCTLRNYPTSIDHCIEWARDNFNGYFVDIIKNVKSFVENQEKFYQELDKESIPKLQIEKLNKIIRYINIIINNSFIECLKIALEEYNEIYNESIIRALKIHPPNTLNPDGSKYWNNSKRCPTAIPFNVNNELAFLFVKNYAQILAKAMSVSIIDDNEYLKKIISEIKIDLKETEKTIENKRKYIRYKNINTENNIEDELKLKNAKKEEIKNRIKLSKKKLNKIKIEAKNLNISEIQKNIDNIFNIQEFEKDDDSNGHVEFIYAASNLKAEMFKIEKCSKIKIKLKAGKIIPAIATTTAAIVGLVSLQLYSFYQTNDIKSLRDHYFNFGIKTFNFCYPTLCKEIKNKQFLENIPEKFTLWDYIEINGSLTINQFIQFIKKKYLIDLSSIIINKQKIYSTQKYLYNEVNSKENDNYDFLDKKLENIYLEQFYKEISYNKKYFFIKINGKINNYNIEMPLFKYNFK